MNLAVTCSDPSRKARDLHGGTVVLRNKRVSFNFLRSPRCASADLKSEIEHFTAITTPQLNAPFQYLQLFWN
jgi:hypothetical protein